MDSEKEIKKWMKAMRRDIINRDNYFDENTVEQNVENNRVTAEKMLNKIHGGGVIVRTERIRADGIAEFSVFRNQN